MSFAEHRALALLIHTFMGLASCASLTDGCSFQSTVSMAKLSEFRGPHCVLLSNIIELLEIMG